MDNEGRIYKIYKHELLIDAEVDGRIYKAGMKYYGKTKAKNVKTERWGRDGSKYTNHTNRFAQAIRDCGWDNFSHEILFLNLTKEEANKLEEILVERYQTRDPSKGFNTNGGGEDVKGNKNHRWNPSLEGTTERERKNYSERIDRKINPEKYKERRKRWYSTHPDYNKEYHRNHKNK